MLPPFEGKISLRGTIQVYFTEPLVFRNKNAKDLQSLDSASSFGPSFWSDLW